MRLHGPAATIAERIPLTAGLLTAIDEDTCLLETGGDSLHNLTGCLGTLGVGFTVLDPPELRELLGALAERYRAAAAAE